MDTNDREDKETDETISKIIGKKNSLKLKPKYERFVDEYLIDLNPARAYKAAGFNASDKAAYQASYQLLQRKDIQRAIQQRMDERARRCHIDQDRVLRELAKIGFANIRDVASWNQHGMSVRDSNLIAEEDAAAISEIAVNLSEYGASVKLKMYDKRSALVDIGNHLGMFEKGKKEDVDPTEKAHQICATVAEMMKTMTQPPEETQK